MEKKATNSKQEQFNPSRDILNEMLFQAQPQPMWVYDIETLFFLAVNRAAITKYGYTEQEFLSMTIKDITPAEDLPALRENSAYSNKEFEQPGVMRHKKKDGSIIFVEISSPIIDVHGRKVKLVTAMDITERITAEQTRLQLQRAVQNSNEIIFTTTKDGTISYINPAFTTVYGYTAEEAIGKNPRILKSGKHTPDEYKEFYQVLQTGKTVRRKIINRAKDGRLLTIETTVDPILNAKGEPEGYVAIQRDITIREQIAEKLAESELRFSQMAETIESVFWMTDAQKQEMLYVSPAYEKIWGRSIEELYRSRRSWVDAIHPDDQAWVWQAMLTKQAAGTYNEVYRITQPDGSIRWIRDRAFPVKDEKGEVYRITGLATDITEYKNAKTILSESEAKFRTLAETSPAAIFIYKEKFIYVNPAAQTLTGYNREELLGMNFWDAVHPDHRELIRQRGEARLRGDKVPNRYEFKILRKDGESRWVEFSAGIFKPNGNAYAIGTAFDITERKAIEEQLRNSEQLYKDLVENSNEVSYLLDKDATITYISPMVEMRTGFRQAELIGRKFFDIIHPDDIANVKREFQRVAMGQSVKSTEFRFNKKTGETIWVRASAVPVMKEAKLDSIRGIAIDITEQKQAETALRRSEERYRELFEQALTGNYVATGDGKIVKCNQMFADIFGFESPEDVITSQTENSCTLDIFQPKFLSLLRTQKKLQNYESQVQRKDGSVIHIVENVMGKFDAHGNLQEIHGSLYNVTEKKTLEEYLRQSQKMESIGTLAGGIAHDFNNILAIILGHASIMSRSKTIDESISSSLDTIIKATQRGTSLVKQILTFARKTDPTIESIRLNDIVTEIVSLAKETFPKTIEFRIDVDPRIKTFNGDYTQIHQAILNLVVNARDAMPNGGTLAISTANVTKAELLNKTSSDMRDEYVRVSVQDTGIGMDEATKSRIFEPFFTTKEKGKGTGLGLAVVYGVVKGHNGHLMVDSTVGVGTTFHLYFPVPPVIHSISDSTQSTSEIVRGGDETILIVEDEDILREVLKQILETSGYTVLSTGDVDEAVRIYTERHRHIDLVISDVGLPKRTGFELLLQLKQINPSIRLIFTSGFFEPGMKNRMMNEGVQHFIDKPYDIAKIARTVRAALDSEM